jgi:hypothetical protein
LCHRIHCIKVKVLLHVDGFPPGTFALGPAAGRRILL